MSHRPAAELEAEAKELLKEYLPKKDELKAKARIAIPSQVMRAQEPMDRIKNLDEVAIGYTEEQARVEAIRCTNCKKHPCIEDCPVKIDVPRFVMQIADGKYQDAIDTIKETSLLPAICGRVCPQEVQCQVRCTVGKSLKDVERAVSIGRLERFAADWEQANGTVKIPAVKPDTGKKVAIVGAGPAGLVVAADIRREGNAVTIFEAFHKLGGVMRYGIPEFRLPNDIIDQEVDTLKKMGVVFQTNFVVGKTRKLEDLMEKDGYDAVFVGSGAGLPMFLGIEGENLIGVFSANEYLTRANLMRAYERGKADTPIYKSNKVAVFGGGNVAMDAARMAKRLGADEVTVVYRRTEKEMPARIEEIAHAKEEGIIFHFLANAKRILGDDDNRVKTLECLRYELGEPDDSGRRRPVPLEGSEFMMEVDTVLVSIGNGSNPLIPQTTKAIDVNRWGNIIVNHNQKTSLENVFAGGDIVLGAATVILAMGEGRRAAAAINDLLAGRPEKEPEPEEPEKPKKSKKK